MLQRLADFNVWSQDIVDDAQLEQVFSFNFRPKQLAPLLARRMLSKDVLLRSAKHPQQNDRATSTANTVIRTTINSDLQQSLQELAAAYVANMPKKSSAAILVVDNQTMAVKAYIGSAEFASTQRYGYVDMVQAIRSPGSTLKPFLYGFALDEGLIHAQSLLADVPRTWGSYRPANFSGSFHGPVSAQAALQRSLNMPAVDLLERFGVNRFVSQLENAGLPLTIPDNKPNLAVILGGVGTSLEKLVQTYAALANEGTTTELTFLQSAQTPQHKLKAAKIKRRLLSKESAWLIHNILSEIERPNALDTLSATLSSVNNASKSGQFAWKTGTSYGFRDAWAIGVNKRYTVGVWLGRPDGTAMPGHYGRITAGPLLFSVVDQLPQSNEKITKPINVQEQTICWPTGTLEKSLQERGQTALCQKKKQAWIINDVVPPTWHIADSDIWQGSIVNYWLDPKTQKQVTMACVSAQNQSLPLPMVKKQAALWPKILTPWLAKKYRRTSQIPPLDERCKANAVAPTASLQIIGIEENNIYRRSGEQGQWPSIMLKTVGGTGNKSWYINGNYIFQTKIGQKRDYLLTEKGKQQIIVQDQQGNTDMINITVR